MTVRIALFLSLWLAAFGWHTCTAQSSDLALQVVVPEEHDVLDADHLQLLSARLNAIATAHGIAGDGVGSFALYPTVQVVESRTIEGTLRPLHTTQLEVVLFVASSIAQRKFGSCMLTLQGEGHSRSEALRKALIALQPNDRKVQDFLQQTREKIVTYYERNMTNIIREAELLAANQDFSSAFILLASYPQAVAGSERVQQVADKLCRTYQKQLCQQIVTMAQAAAAIEDYDQALALLANVDATSDCQADAHRLIASINKDVRSAHAREELQRQREHTLERDRIAAVRAIGVAYARRQPDPTYVNFVGLP